MYMPHPKVASPENPDVTIWRYMDFTKYISLLEKKSLFFCRVDKLGDKNEMSLPVANKRENLEYYNKHFKQIEKAFSGKLTLEIWNAIISHTRTSILVNSWSMNEFESAAMWSIYSKSNMGVAITSSFTQLCNSLKSAEDDILIGKVKYMNYEIEKIEDDTIFGYVTHKLKSYNFENELRAMLIKQSDGYKPKYETGKYVISDLMSLIKAVYIAPTSPDWFYDLVVSTTKKFGYNFDFKKSNLDDTSLY